MQTGRHGVQIVNEKVGVNIATVFGPYLTPQSAAELHRTTGARSLAGSEQEPPPDDQEQT